MPVQIQLRHDTAANWTSADPTLALGEVGIETDTDKMKFGDGATAWTGLSYAGGGSTPGLPAVLGVDDDAAGADIIGVDRLEAATAVPAAIEDPGTSTGGSAEVPTADGSGSWAWAAPGAAALNPGTLPEISSPSTPSSGNVYLYAKSDGRVYSKDDAGTEFGPFDAAGGGSGSEAAITTLIRGTADVILYNPISIGPSPSDDGHSWHVGTGAGETTSLVQLPAYTTPVTEITMMAWLLRTGTVSQVTSVIRQETGGAFIIMCYSGGGTPGHAISSDGSTGGKLGAGVIDDGSWHHYAFTWKKNTTNGFRAFVDGALDSARNSANADLPSNTNGIGIGVSPAGFGEQCAGWIAHAAVFARALTDTEVADIYTAGLDPW